MHLRWMVHRDTKSDNVLLFSRPEQAKVSDLGRSRDTRQSPRFIPNDYAHGRGDLRFAPPELLWGLGDSSDADLMVRGDLYMLGSLLFELSTGVGLTSVVFGDPRAVALAAHGLDVGSRQSNFELRQHEIRERYEAAYDQFSAELPAAIRGPATDLLRLLTHPDPARRTPAFRRRRHRDDWDLQWLLMRVDVLRRILSAAAAAAARRRRKKTLR